MHEYAVKVLGIKDGDTFVGEMVTKVRIVTPIGVIEGSVTNKADFRLARINAFEKKDPSGKGVEAMAMLKERAIAAGGCGIITSEVEVLKRDKYKRVLCDLWLGGTCINDALVEAGLATMYYGDYDEEEADDVDWL